MITWKWKKDTPEIVRMKTLAGITPKTGFDKFKDSVNDGKKRLRDIKTELKIRMFAGIHYVYYQKLNGKNQRLHKWMLRGMW